MFFLNFAIHYHFPIFSWLLGNTVCHIYSWQVHHPQWIRKKFILILESSSSSIQRRKRPFASFLTLLRKHFHTTWNVLAMAQKPKLLLPQKNGDEMCTVTCLTFSLFLLSVFIFLHHHYLLFCIWDLWVFAYPWVSICIKIAILAYLEVLGCTYKHIWNVNIARLIST